MPAVRIRASIKHDHLVSMIDGKPYKMPRPAISAGMVIRMRVIATPTISFAIT